MNEDRVEGTECRGLESHSRELFLESVAGVDMATLSRLTRARQSALHTAAGRPGGFFHIKVWIPAAGFTAAALCGIALWMGSLANHGATQGVAAADTQPNLEDLDVVAASDDDAAHAVDAMEMLQNDIGFYDFADDAANAEPTA